jgi:Flp pilus assembly protein TadB
MRERLIAVSPIILFVIAVPLATWLVGPLHSIYVLIALALVIVAMFVLKRKYPQRTKQQERRSPGRG